jgi:hypothetical protein
MEIFAIEDAAEKYYKQFITSFLTYNKVIGNADIISVLKTPYPIFYDVINQEITVKEKYRKQLEEQTKKSKENVHISSKNKTRTGKR